MAQAEVWKLCKICRGYYTSKEGNYSTCSETCSKENRKRLSRNYLLRNPEAMAKAKKRAKEYNTKHPNKKKQCNKTWNQNNKGRANYHGSLYRMKKKSATPGWANFIKIKEIYENCPEGFHVDHIIPLNGKTVCGLHIETNLQYLSASENSKKSNKYGTSRS